MAAEVISKQSHPHLEALSDPPGDARHLASVAVAAPRPTLPPLLRTPPRHADAFAVEDMVREIVMSGQGTAVSHAHRVLKRALDLTVAVIGLTLCAPLFLLIILLIRLDSEGPAFFRQRRVGYLGRPFFMVKFRTMVAGSIVQLDGETHKPRRDPRITRIGRFLRTTSLDELPQLINVLRGEMSLVGPRPELVEIVRANYMPWQYQRFLVPQGITGWWQVTGRGNKLCHQHTDDDLYYITHASFAFDLKILLMTVRAVLVREGAF